MKKTLLPFIALLCISFSLKADIVHIDYGEGWVFEANAAETVDLDDDGVMDFTMNPGGDIIGMSPAISCFIRNEELFDGVNTIRVMNDGDHVGDGEDEIFEDFQDGEAHSASRGLAPGWTDGEPHFVGLMFFSNNTFGWMKVIPNVETGTMTITELAYGTEAGVAVDVGDTGLASSISTLDIPKSVKTFPNPASEIMNISFENQSANDLDVAVYNGLGQVVFRKEINGEVNVEMEINVGDWTGGVYNVVFQNNDGILLSRRVMILRE